MQSETADFAQVPPPGEQDKSYASSLILAYYTCKRDKIQNRKHITYLIAVRKGPSYGRDR